jgi:hypothetical protein
MMIAASTGVGISGITSGEDEEVLRVAFVTARFNMEKTT